MVGLIEPSWPVGWVCGTARFCALAGFDGTRSSHSTSQRVGYGRMLEARRPARQPGQQPQTLWPCPRLDDKVGAQRRVHSRFCGRDARRGRVGGRVRLTRRPGSTSLKSSTPISRRKKLTALALTTRNERTRWRYGPRKVAPDAIEGHTLAPRVWISGGPCGIIWGTHQVDCGDAPWQRAAGQPFRSCLRVVVGMPSGS
jgi:hypothetical protein